MSDKEICLTAAIRRDICTGFNKDNCSDSGRYEEKVCVAKDQNAREALTKEFKRICGQRYEGIGTANRLFKEAWLCKWDESQFTSVAQRK